MRTAPALRKRIALRSIPAGQDQPVQGQPAQAQNTPSHSSSSKRRRQTGGENAASRDVNSGGGEGEDEDGDEDGEAFQTNTRPVKEMRKTLPPEPKRPRTTASRQEPAPRESVRRESTRPSPTRQEADRREPAARRPATSQARTSTRDRRRSTSAEAPAASGSTGSPPGTRTTFSQIQKQKQVIVRQSRESRDLVFQQRRAWDDEDCALLIDLIRIYRAAWSSIERSEDSQGFHYPRNQQAYRDKARNMKVDFLITDSILPPCFDHVALGKKEVERLISLGKNPSRREADVDAFGDPTNTDYVPRPTDD